MKSSHKRLFWIVIALILLINVGRILSWPTQSSGNGQDSVIISEFLTNNRTGLQDEDGDYADWIEIYNRSARDINLEGWSLSDDPNRPDKWRFPKLTLPANGYTIVFASGKDRRDIAEADDGTETHPHTNFKLDGAGGTLTLYNPTSRRFLDANPVVYPSQFPDVSYGPCERDGDGCYFETPTPGATNAAPRTEPTGVSHEKTPLTFSHERGFYEEPFDLTLAADLANATILYTLDGSEPSGGAGMVYEGPITVEGTTIVRATVTTLDGDALPTVTHTYIFLADVLAQPAHPAGFPDTWGVYSGDSPGLPAGSPVIADYEMDPEIVGNPAYGPLLPTALQSLPTLSLVTDVANLDIYANPEMRGPEWERPVSVEFWPAGDPAGGFQIDAGIRIQGGFARWEHVKKHPFRLFFRGQYGAKKLDYPIFPHSPVESFNTLTLRAGMQDSFSGYSATLERERLITFTRDEWARDTQIAISSVGSHGIFVHLYLNGLYWGLYNVVERPDASFTSSYMGGDVGDWFAVNHSGDISGDNSRFTNLLRLAKEGGLADPTKYATILEFIDPVQFSDYVIINWFMGNTDWPEYNWYAGVNYPAGRNQFFVWDGEAGWEQGSQIVLGPDALPGAPYPNVIKLLLQALMENADFRMTFADRLYKQLFNDGALADEASQERWLAINAEIESAIIAESARWGDARLEDPITQEDWRQARDFVLAQMNGNADKLIALTRDVGYYPDIDPPTWSQPGGVFKDELTLEMASTVGDIFYTTDGNDPREPGSGAVSESAALYSEPLHLTGETTVKARVKQGDVWSALREAQFTEASQQARLCVTEIMYNPPGGGDYEFLELTNVGDAQMDLSFAQFEGIRFHFPEGSIIGPGESAVLIRDYYAYRERYPTAPFDGFFQGSLANEGEAIILKDVHGNQLLSVTYDDEAGWPVSADGLGDSLVRVNCLGDADDPRNWDVSNDIDGDPGVYGFPPEGFPG
ncbi:MAG TPA: hypothetical protein G4N94_06700 [Caldilineae bacterium]|nr:hypothetical protein [Caldilineae bacterium]